MIAAPISAGLLSLDAAQLRTVEIGLLLGTPVLKLRGDYLAIVTLGFGEIIRVFLNNLSQPVNITNGPQGVTLIGLDEGAKLSGLQRIVENDAQAGTEDDGADAPAADDDTP